MLMSGTSRTVETNQPGIHDKLEALVKKYQTGRFERPVADHTRRAFEEVLPWLQDAKGPLILDSCCGVGESTARLAERFPDARVLGVDKSANRLDKHHAYADDSRNYRVIRADLNDFWRLLVEANIAFEQQYLLYPNPYPKSSQVQKRWHASAVLPFLMKLAPHIEVRSNWRLYLEEFEFAARFYGFTGHLDQVLESEDAMTPFERKYRDSAQTCFRLKVSKSSD